ncbi:MAG TPA: multiheme c-type cytochrome [Phycisphaerae bacterium]|nr:multiheme c-type cytochrome [Phycisphaerae bacterium]
MQPGLLPRVFSIALVTALMPLAARAAEKVPAQHATLTPQQIQELTRAHAPGAALVTELTTPLDPAALGPLPLPLTPVNLSLLMRAGAADAVAGFVGARDATPPTVNVLYPNGGETIPAESSVNVTWTATDENQIGSIDVFVTFDGGATFDTIALGLPGTQTTVTWFPANRPTTTARIRVEATDVTLNTGSDESDAAFTVTAVPGGTVPTTLRDFDQPGTQPFEHGIDIRDPGNNCAGCHGNYDPAAEPYFAWRGSMMANASRDPLFEACLTVANQDAPSSGDLCIRCHVPKAWTAGRSTPTSGSAILYNDRSGVSCDVCHRMVDPLYNEENPSADVGILANLSNPPSGFGNGMYVLDPDGVRRGPFSDVQPLHQILVSPFHQDAAFCGTCHDVSNPAFEHDGNGNYVPNALDEPASDFSAHTLMPIERTYSEWLASAYNTPGGIYAPQFGGNKDYVSTCQDCHMRDVTGAGCAFVPARNNMPLHDFTGGSAWMIEQLAGLFEEDLDAAAQQAAAARARAILANAATLDAAIDGTQLRVRVTNETGHKLPTGYPEGRRMWLNVKFYAGPTLLGESGAYNAATGELLADPQAKVYAAELGVDTALASSTGLPEGPSFHFVLNNKIYKDNRIPPRGFTNAAFAQFGGAPVGATYADGQHWDDTWYTVPSCADSAEVTLYYQSTSKEYVEFLRDENTTDARGQAMYDLWNNNGKCPPEVMATVTLAMPDCNANGTPDLCETGVIVNGDFDGDGDVDLDDHAAFVTCMGGPGMPPAPGDANCATTCTLAFDHDADGDVDLADYQALGM